MSDFATLAPAIAAALNGTLRTHDAGGDPINPSDRGAIDLSGDYAGLVVILRPGYGAERTRVRATMSQTTESRDGCDYRETPYLHTLETAAAMSRGAPAIARQIATKLLPPALDMLEGFRAKRREYHAHRDRLAAVMSRYQSAFPRARISLRDRDTQARFELSTGHMAPEYRYIDARLNADGRLTVDRMSGIEEGVARVLCRSIVEAPGTVEAAIDAVEIAAARLAECGQHDRAATLRRLAKSLA